MSNTVTEMTKILIINSTSSQINGVSKVILAYYHNFLKKDIIIDFVFNDEPFEDFKTEIVINRGNYYIVPRSMKHIFRYEKELISLIKKGNYDIVHAHGNSSSLYFEMNAAKRAGCKVRISHSHNTYSRKKIANVLLRPFFLHSYTDGFACGNEAGKWMFRNKPFSVINNGVQTESFIFNDEYRKEIRETYGVSSQDILIGNVGLLNEQKNQQVLIRIARELQIAGKHFKLMIVGFGRLENTLKNLVEELGLSNKIIFTGKVTDAYKYYSAFDVFIMTSLYEGLPLVLVEAQAAGLPIIAADTISKQADICGKMQFLSLSDPYKTWAEKIISLPTINRDEASRENADLLKQNGYDIKENAIELEKKYIEMKRN